jgi:hypothetical protein
VLPDLTINREISRFHCKSHDLTIRAFYLTIFPSIHMKVIFLKTVTRNDEIEKNFCQRQLRLIYAVSDFYHLLHYHHRQIIDYHAQFRFSRS